MANTYRAPYAACPLSIVLRLQAGGFQKPEGTSDPAPRKSTSGPGPCSAVQLSPQNFIQSPKQPEQPPLSIHHYALCELRILPLPKVYEGNLVSHHSKLQLPQSVFHHSFHQLSSLKPNTLHAKYSYRLIHASPLLPPHPVLHILMTLQALQKAG